MDEHQVVWNEKVAEKIIKNLEKRVQLGQSLHSLKKPGLLNA